MQTPLLREVLINISTPPLPPEAIDGLNQLSNRIFLQTGSLNK